MNLSYKATQFIIEAIDCQIKAYQERLKVIEDVDEDEASDIGNDWGFLEALRIDLAQSLEKWVAPKALLSDEQQVNAVLDRPDEQSKNQPALNNGNHTTMEIPVELVPVVRDLIAKHQV